MFCKICNVAHAAHELRDGKCIACIHAENAKLVTQNKWLLSEQEHEESIRKHLQDENARLAAAMECAAGYVRILVVCGMGHDLEEVEKMGKDVLVTLANPSRALHELLGPTVDILYEIQYIVSPWTGFAALKERIDTELARLRAAMGDGK